jgi:hypothetical protein
MFNRATRGHTPPTPLSSDHDRLCELHQWQANLRILDVKEIKTVAYTPLSHPFVEASLARFGGNARTARCSGRPPLGSSAIGQERTFR